MGHYIAAYTNDGKAVADMYRSAMDPHRQDIYTFLDARDLAGDWSGLGERIFFYHDVVSALSKIPDGKVNNVERDFLNACLGFSGVRIEFC